MLLFLPQHHLLPSAAGPSSQTKVHGLWALFIRLALGFSVNLDGSAQLPTVDASVAPYRGLEAFPTSMVGYGYTTTNSGLIGRLAHACSPGYRFSSWCPPYFLAERSIRELFQGPSKRGLGVVPYRYAVASFARPRAHLLSHGDSTVRPRGQIAEVFMTIIPACDPTADLSLEGAFSDAPTRVICRLNAESCALLVGGSVGEKSAAQFEEGTESGYSMRQTCGEDTNCSQMSPLAPFSAPMPSALFEEASDQSPGLVLIQDSLAPVSSSRVLAA